MTAGIRFGRFLLFIFRPLIYLIFPHKFIGRELVPQDDRPLVICCNHISYLDPVFLLIGTRRPIYFMAKAELFENRFAGWALRVLFGVFAVERGTGDRSAIDHSLDLVREGKLMGIFPEGTRSKDGTLGRAKSGAALILSLTGAEMLPACVVTKDQKVRAFHKSVIAFGETQTCEDLHLTGEKPELRFASRAIMSAISDLAEEAKKSLKQR